MTADRMEDLHRELDRAIEQVQSTFGRSYPLVIGGREVRAAAEFDDRSPIDTRILLGTFQQGGREQARDAIAAARAAFPAWSARPWRDRVALLKKVADAIRARRWELSALMGYEAGKNRLECVGDVEESADLIEYYCDQVEQHDGLRHQARHARARRREHQRAAAVRRLGGDFAVQFPARARGRTGRRRAGRRQHRRVQAGVGDAAARLRAVRGDGARRASRPASSTSSPAAAAPPARSSIDNPGVDGIVFTGSKDVGMRLIRDNAARAVPRPLIIEMGGKNPALIMRSADLDKATDGVMRSAFGAQGQKCSACSRVYVTKPIRDEFVRLLVEKTKKIKIGNPLNRDVYLGPVINEEAVKTYERAVEQARAGRRHDPHRRPAPDRRRVRPRLLRRADHHRRPAARPSAVFRGAVRADHRSSATSRRSTRRSTLANRHGIRPHRRHLLRGRSRNRRSSSSASRRA